MKLLNSKVYQDKEYVLQDVRGFIPIEKKGIPEGWYGGRVKQLGKTDIQGVYLCMDCLDTEKVLDILVFEDELVVKESNSPEDPKGNEGEEGTDGEDDNGDVVDYTERTNAELVKILEELGVEVPKKYTKPELIELINMEKENGNE